MQNSKINMSRKSFLSSPLFILRLEGAVLFFLSIYLYQYFQGSWWLFLALFFSPDLSMVGYLFGSKTGAIVYNALHAEMAPAILVGCGIFFSMPILVKLALIWFCHIYFDRMLGFGLKYLDEFKHTHLGRLSFGKKEKK